MLRALFLLAVWLPLCSLAADTILLRNGKTIEGKIVSQSQFQVRIRTDKGVKSVSKSSIRRIRFGSAAPAKSEADQAAEKKRLEARRKKAAEARKRREAQGNTEAAKKSQTKKPAPPRPSRRPARVEGNPLLRSAIIPGWGQASQGRSGPAYGYGGVFFSFFALGVALEWENRGLIAEVNARQSELELMALGRGMSGDSLDLWQTLRLDNARERANNNIRLGNSVWTIAGLVYVANLIDVQLAGGSSVGFAPGPDAGALVFRMRF